MFGYLFVKYLQAGIVRTHRFCFILTRDTAEDKKVLISNPMRNHQSRRLASRAVLMAVVPLALYLGTPTTLPASDSTTTVSVDPSPLNMPLPAGVDAETGFRMGRYRGPVPQTNPGTEVVDTKRVAELHATGEVVFIDVFPPRGLGANPMDGTWMTNESHESIESATWLPEVGRGYVEQEHIDYFQRNLKLLTENNKDKPLLFFCTADCWQSWNAAKRALQYGYKNIFWYPEGTDGWAEEGHSLVLVEPVNFFGE